MLWTHTQYDLFYSRWPHKSTAPLQFFSFANMLRPFFRSHHALFRIHPPDQTNHRYLKEPSTGCVPCAGVPEERPCLCLNDLKSLRPLAVGVWDRPKEESARSWTRTREACCSQSLLLLLFRSLSYTSHWR